jgi:microcystin-dependent protein
MTEPFIGEVRAMSFGFAPRGWAQCNGALLPISQNQALFALLGTTFGGNGQTTFALPNLQGRTPMHAGNGYQLGQSGGEAAHTLTTSELPAHAHVASGSVGGADSIGPGNAFLTQRATQAYHAPTNTVPLNPQSLQSVGGSQPHENMQPYMTVNFCIALQGVFPSQS